jgi:hypothetical protein
VEHAGRSSRNNAALHKSALPTRACSILAQLLLLLSPCLLFNDTQQPAFASSFTHQTTESRTLGPKDQNDEFIELYDLSSPPSNIRSWLVNRSNESDTNITRDNSDSEEEEADEPECGEWRRSVKNGIDSDADRVDLNSRMATTIARMNRWSPPDLFPASNRIAPYETTTWVVNAILTEYRRSTDQDYHLNLRDASGKTMIAEIPCPCCIGSSNSITSLIAAARSQFDSHLTPTDTFQPANIPVRVTGVAMFDFPHEGQISAAANYIELHPVLEIAFNVDLNAPSVVGAIINGKKLLVSGFNFDDGTVLLVNGQEQRTRNDEDDPRMQLIAKKAGKFIAPGQTVTLQVRKSDGTVSEGFSFTKPND